MFSIISLKQKNINYFNRHHAEWWWCWCITLFFVIFSGFSLRGFTFNRYYRLQWPSRDIFPITWRLAGVRVNSLKFLHRTTLFIKFLQNQKGFNHSSIKCLGLPFFYSKHFLTKTQCLYLGIIRFWIMLTFPLHSIYC